MKVAFKVFVLLVICIGVVIAWRTAFPSGTWRYRMTVTVETPEGIKTGSAVREVIAGCEPQLWQTTPCVATMSKGEAVVVDLGKRGALFALGNNYGVVFAAFPLSGFHGRLTEDVIKHYAHLQAGPVVLSPDNYPMFVHFKDRQDPMTVEAVSPTNTEDKPNYAPAETIKTFSNAFGEGVRIKSVTIEMTKEPVTWEIQKWLPWLPSIHGDYLNGKTSGGGPELSSILFGWDFKKGD